MRSNFLLFIMLAFVESLNAQSPDWAMSNSNGGTDHDWGQSIASDAFGNTIVVGGFYSPSIVFGSTVLTNPNIGKYTSFIVRYDVNGNVVWAKQPITVGGAHYNRATDVEIDNYNNIYVTGVYHSTTITFDTITLTQPNYYGYAKYIVKYNSLGNIIWAITTYGEQQLAIVYPPQLYSDPTPLNKIAINKNNGDIYMAGTFDVDSMYFGSTVLTNVTTVITTQYKRDVFIAKYDSSGNFIWAKSIGGDKQDFASDIAVYNSNVFVTGAFNSSILHVDSLTLTNPNQSGLWFQNFEPFVAKYDTSGNAVWVKKGAATLLGRSNSSKSITADTSGNCYLAGEFSSNFIVFDNDTLFNIDTINGYSKIYVTKFDSLGNVHWTKTFANGIGNDWAHAVQTDGIGNVYVNGSVWSDALSFDSLVMSFNGYGVFIAKLNPSGGLIWVKSPQGSFNQQKFLIGLSVSNIGNVFLTGSFRSKIYFVPDTLISNGLSDIFTAAILNCSPSFSAITAQSSTTFCQGDSVILSAASGYISYQWFRHNYAIPGATALNYIAKSSGRYHCQSQNATLCIDTSNVVIVNVPCKPIEPNQERGITSNELETHSFQISPNPGSGNFIMISPGGQLQILNTIGELMFSKGIPEGKCIFDISEYSDGIYFIRLMTGETNLTQKLILSH